MGLIYVVWGSTYLAIRVTVETLPPMLSAGVRFIVAGSILYFLAARRLPTAERPTRIQWRSATIVGGALLVGGNGGVVVASSWGVPSGVAALLVGMVPLWMALIGWLAYRERTPPLAIAGLIIGFAGVALLANPSGGVPLTGALLIVGGTLAWSAGSLYSRRAPLPKSPFVATGMEMLAGGALQILTGLVIGELGDLHPSQISARSLTALAYLIFVGALIGFTAYIWALQNTRTSLVATYASVNPVIAVVLGAVILSERVAAQDLLAGAMIVGSVALIIAAKHPPPQASVADAPSAASV